MRTVAIGKVLSKNDLGLTGSHQAGMHVPKNQSFLDFFPRLDSTTPNPEATFDVILDVSGLAYEVRFIHYNNKLLKTGTRDEYRLTGGVTNLMKDSGLKEGDVFAFVKRGELYVAIESVKPDGILPDDKSWAIVS